MALPEAAQRYADRIDVWSDERIGNEYIFIDYVRGWKSGSDPLGCVHGDMAANIKEAVLRVGDALPCDCPECIPQPLCTERTGTL